MRFTISDHEVYSRLGDDDLRPKGRSDKPRHRRDTRKAVPSVAGRVMLDLIPKIYDLERQVRLMGEDDKRTYQPINTMTVGIDGRPELLHDLSQARFDIRVDVGPRLHHSTDRSCHADVGLCQE